MPNELNLFIGTVEAHARADRSGAFAGAFIVCERINKASEAIAIKLYAPRAPRSLADATNMRCVNVIYPRVKRTFRLCMRGTPVYRCVCAQCAHLSDKAGPCCSVRCGFN